MTQHQVLTPNTRHTTRKYRTHEDVLLLIPAGNATLQVTDFYQSRIDPDIWYVTYQRREC